MQKNKYTDGNRVIYATEKAFHILYKEQGFYLYTEPSVKEVAQLYATDTNAKSNSTGNTKSNKKPVRRKAAANK